MSVDTSFEQPEAADANTDQRVPMARSPVQCSICGCQSPLFTYFVLDKQGNWRCPRCQARYQEHKQRRGYLSILPLSLALVVWAALIFHDPWSAAYLGVNLLLYMLLLQGVVPLHELAHAAGAWLMRGVVFALYFGYSWGLRERRIGSVAVAVQPLSLAGFCISGFADRRRIAGRTAITIAAPLVMHALILLALLPGLEFGRVVTTLAWREVFFVVNAIVLLENLIPRQVKLGPMPLNSDGMWLLQLARRKVEAATLHTSYFLAAMVYALRAGDYQRGVQVTRAGLALYPDQFHLRNGLAVGLIYLRDYDAARSILQDLLAAGEAVSPDVRALVWNNLAHMAIEEEATGPALDQALGYARQAYQFVPWMPEVRGTLGAILVAQGQTNEGLSHLLATYPDLGTDRARANNLAYQALAQWQQGNAASAQELVRRADQLDPKDQVVKRIQARLASGEAIVTQE